MVLDTCNKCNRHLMSIHRNTCSQQEYPHIGILESFSYVRGSHHNTCSIRKGRICMVLDTCNRYSRHLKSILRNTCSQQEYPHIDILESFSCALGSHHSICSIHKGRICMVLGPM